MRSSLASGFACIFSALMIGGCSSYLEAIPQTTPGSVAGYIKDIEQASGSLSGVTPSEYLFAGIGYTNKACDTFFEDLGQMQKDSKFIDRAITSVITSGSALLAAFEAGKSAIRNAAVVAAGLTAINDLNKLVDEMYFFSKYKGALRYQVRQQMGLYLDDIAGLLDRIDKYETDKQRRKALIVTRSVIEGYANLCSISNLNQIVETAVAGGEPVRVVPAFPNLATRYSHSERRYEERSDDQRHYRRGSGDGLSGLVPNYRVGR